MAVLQLEWKFTEARFAKMSGKKCECVVQKCNNQKERGQQESQLLRKIPKLRGCFKAVSSQVKTTDWLGLDIVEF